MKNQGLKLYQTGRLVEAHQAFSQACALTPADVECWIMLGVTSAQLGALPQAIAHLQQATRIQPASAPAWSNLGLALLNANQLHEAEASLRRAIELDPGDAGVCNNLGALYRQQGRVDAAIEAYRQAIRLQPRNANAHSNLGGILQEQCRADEAIAAYRQALKIEPRFARAEYNLGCVLQGGGQHEQARYHFRKALQLEPSLSEAAAALASIEEKEGRFEEARKILAPLLESQAPPASAATVYAAIARRSGETADAIELLLATSQRADLSNVERQAVEYALGDLYDSQGDYDQAFAHYQRANQARPYRIDSAADGQRIRRIMSRFPAAGQPAPPAPARGRPPAIFIVGMPRSSTSLAEQILASHPDVHGGGELPYMAELLAQLARDKGVSSRDALDHLDTRDIQALGQRYLKKLRALNPKARFVTDKMPHNFLYLGLIAQAIPGVRIVHCKRNALDTCLSIYFHNFNASHPYASDLAALGTYYRRYEMLMAHWRETLGEQLLDLCYEELLADQEGVTRRLLEHCGLDWNPACLAFHENTRIVNTPSYDQVRRPIYKSSHERWRNYEKHLAPLLAALESTGSPAL